MLFKRCFQLQQQLAFQFRLPFSSQQNRKNYYDILGLQKNASIKEIKEAYRNLAMKYHPDVNLSGNETNEGDARKFQDVAEAYAVLSQIQSRNAYDM